MCSLDRFIHWQRKAEIISRYDEFLQNRAAPVVRSIPSGIRAFSAYFRNISAYRDFFASAAGR
jgi:hypothetical protein